MCIGQYRADLVAQDKVLVEVKTARTIQPEHAKLTLNCLKASTLSVAFLLNFGSKAEFKRLISTR